MVDCLYNPPSTRVGSSNFSGRANQHRSSFPIINRGLIIIRFKQPFVDWVNEADPYPRSGTRMSIEQVNDDSPAFLIHDYASEEFENWLEECYELLFEQILEEWYVDPVLWPQDRTLQLFKAWCDVEFTAW
jgi:hypothetical protein